MAELLASYGEQAQAESLFGRALQADELAAEARYQLLRRWAAVRQGVSKCERLLDAAELKPAGSWDRSECVGLIRNELTTQAEAEAAGQLAAKTADAELSGDLLFLQSQLTADLSFAATLLWKLHESGRLDIARLAWGCQVWNMTDQPRRVIEVCEQALRAGRELPVAAATELAKAYRAEHRDMDARRAASRDGTATTAPPGTHRARQASMGGFF